MSWGKKEKGVVGFRVAGLADVRGAGAGATAVRPRATELACEAAPAGAHGAAAVSVAAGIVAPAAAAAVVDTPVDNPPFPAAAGPSTVAPPSAPIAPSVDRRRKQPLPMLMLLIILNSVIPAIKRKGHVQALHRRWDLNRHGWLNLHRQLERRRYPLHGRGRLYPMNRNRRRNPLHRRLNPRKSIASNGGEELARGRTVRRSSCQIRRRGRRPSCWPAGEPSRGGPGQRGP